MRSCFNSSKGFVFMQSDINYKRKQQFNLQTGSNDLTDVSPRAAESNMVSFIILLLALECSLAIFALQRYHQAYSEPFVSSVNANHSSDWLKDLHFFFFLFVSCLPERSRKRYPCDVVYIL